MSVKKSLLENFFKNHSKTAKSSSDSIRMKTLNNEPEFRSNSPGGLNCNSKKNHSRPVSSNGSLTPCKSDLSVSESSLPSNIANAIKKVTVKTIFSYSNFSFDENMNWLLYCFLNLLSLVDTQGPASTVKNNRSKANEVFKTYLKSPGFLIQQIRKIPSFLQSTPLPTSVTSSLKASFKLINISKLSNCLELYEIVMESLALLRNLPQTKPRCESTPKKLTKNSQVRKSPLLYSPLERSSSTFTLKKPLQLNSTRPKLASTMKTCSKLQPPKPAQYKSIVKCNKADRFMLESRANKRLHERIRKFLQDKSGTGGNGLNEEDIGQQLLNEFVSGLPVADISSNSEKFIKFFSKSKEFEKAVKGIASRIS